MRFPGFGSPAAHRFRLGGPQGEQKVAVKVADGQIQLWSGGELLEAHSLGACGWHTAVLSNSKEHALCLQTHDGGAARELLLRAGGKGSREQVEQLQRRLNTATMDGQQEQRQQHTAVAMKRQAAQPTCGQPDSPQGSLAALRPRHCQPRDGSDGEDATRPCPRSLSFGSPVTEAEEGTAGSQGSAAAAAADEMESGSETESEWDDEGQADSGCLGGCSWQQQGSTVPAQQEAAAAEDVHPRTARSVPTSPVLPGLPLVASGAAAAIARRPFASAPASPAGANRHQAAQSSAQLPVRLLSFSGRPGGSPVDSQVVQRLEAAVSQLSAELAQSRGGSSQAASPTQAPQPAEAVARERDEPASIAQPPSPGAAPEAASQAAAAAAARDQESQGGWRRREELLLQENALLLQQQAAMQAELGRMQAQLSAAAADNIRLASEAEGAVRQLAAASEAAHAGQQREAELRAVFAAAVGQCEGVGRELAGLSARLETKAAQCEELRGCVEALSRDKEGLAVALAQAQQLAKDATPAGFELQSAELRRQAQAAQQEAAAARADASAACAKAAEAQRREAEVAGHMREAARCMEDAATARAAGLAREQQLAGEVRSLRQQLAGRLPGSDPARALQERADQLAAENERLQQEHAALLGQVQQLQAVGQELSASCRQLEGGMQAARRERDGLCTALSQAQAAHTAAQQQWEAQVQKLEAALSTATAHLAASQDRAEGGRAAAAALQSQVDAVKQEAQQAQQRAAAREQELLAELRLAGVKAEAEQRGAASSAAAAEAEAARQQEQLRAREAELAELRKEAARLTAEHGLLQEDLQRAREERTVMARDLQLEVSAAQAEASRLALELRSMQASAEEQGRAAGEAQRAAKQALAQSAAAAAAHSTAAHERKQLQARLDRLAVERDRAARERDAAQLRCAALQQQCRLLDAVVQGQAALGGRSGRRWGKRGGGAKENGGSSVDDGEYRIQAHRGSSCSADGES